MSSIRLKTKKDIKSFFKILAEESIRGAKSQILDSGAEALKRQEELDKEAYSNIREEIGDEEAPAGPPPPPRPTKDLSSGVESEEEISSAAVEETLPEVSIEDVSLDSIAKKIKIMRSGLSVDDTSVQAPLRTYFDLLNEPERKALYAFLNAIAAMMTGAATGEDASDPSDPPYNVQMTSDSGDEEVTSDIEDDVEIEEEEETPERSSSDLPDMPIRVGGVQEKQAISEIRNKVLKLLKKS